MTQLRTLGEAVNDVALQDFRLTILDPTGTNIQKVFSAHDLNQAGIVDGITSTVRGGACKGLTFSGRPDLIGATGGEIVKFEGTDGGTWQPLGYGTILEGWPVREAQEAKPYVADADELLRYSLVDRRVYAPQDPAAIAKSLAERLRHPALKYDPARFPATGTTLAGEFDLPGATFLDAFTQLAEAAEQAGSSVSFGVDPSGFIFFEPLTAVARIPYEEEEFAHLKVDARGLVTSVYWVVGNKPSLEGYSTRYYKPSTLVHTTTPNPALHSLYRRPVARQATDNGTLYEAIKPNSTSGSGFSDPANAYDDSLGTFAQRTATTGAPDIYFFTSATESYVYGAEILYRYDYDAGIVDAGLLPTYIRQSDNSSLGASAYYPLPYSHGSYSVFSIFMPPGRTYTDESGAWDFKRFDGFGARVRQLGTGHFSIADVKLYRLNVAALVAAARREIKTPAFEPAQLTPRRLTPYGREGYWVPHDLKSIIVERTPWGDIESPVAEIRYTFNEIERFQTIVDLGNANREGDAQTIENIRLGVERLTSEQEVKIGRRL